MHLLSILPLLLVTLPARGVQWQPCPAAPQQALAAARAAQGRDLPLARACFAAAYAGAPPGPAQDAALAALQDAQLAVLERFGEPSAPPDARFPVTWRELMRLMAWKSIMNLPELDALQGRWDVYLLHGQLACLEETGGGAEGAVRSFTHALAMRESGAVRRLLARVSLGRGDTAGALASATAARRHRELPADGAAALLLQFQALALGSGLSGGAVSALGGASSLALGGAAPADAEDVWEEVRDLIASRFRALGVALPANDPLRLDATPSFLRLPMAALLPAPANHSEGAAAGLAVAGGEQALWGRAASAAAAEQWSAQGYTVLRGLLPPAYLAALRRRHEELFYPAPGQEGGAGGSGGLRIEPDAAQRRRLLWDEELSLYIGTRLLPAMTAITGAPLTNTYACSIAYEAGGDLKPHVDREQNAFSLSLNLGLDPEDAPDWPLWVSPEGKGEEAGVPVRLKPGDALFYGGPRHTHFRYPLEGARRSMQVIFGFRDMHPGHCNSQ
jgi:hypothetical protein